MKNHNIELIKIENKEDVNDVKKGRNGGCVAFPVGTVLNKNCIDGEDCDTLPFVPNSILSGNDQALIHIGKTFFDVDLTETLLSLSANPAKKSAKKAAKAVSTKKPAKPKAKKESLLAKENKKMQAAAKAKRAAKKNK